MEASLDARPRFRSSLVAITEVDCPGTDHGAETSPVDLVLFPRHGAYRYRQDGHAAEVVDPTRVVFLRRDVPYAVRHRHRRGDSTTAVWLAPAVLDEVLGAMPSLVAPSDPRADLAIRWLTHALASDPGLDACSVEDLLLRLVAASMAPAAGGRRTRRPTLDRQRRLVRRTQAALIERMDEPLTLAQLAAEVGASPFHLARTFRALTGCSIHGYRRRLRIRTAIDRLLDAGRTRDLTGLGVDLGFADHSHFSAVLRRELGVPPSTVRDALDLATCQRLLERARFA